MKVRLRCLDAQIDYCTEQERKKAIESINGYGVEFDFMPQDGGQISFFNKLGCFHLTIDYSNISIATPDAPIIPEWVGKVWNDIYISEIEIVEWYEE